MKKYSAFLVLFLSSVTVYAQSFANGQAARAVFGQTNFTAGSASPSQTILGAVGGLAFYNGILYVADSSRVAATPQNSRIVAFQVNQLPGIHDDLANDNLTNTDCYLCGFPASFSLGQSTWAPTNTTCATGVSTCFTTNRTQTGMANATGVATDGHYFAVADTDNNRVMLWNEMPTQNNTPADIVIGQTSFTDFKSPQTVDKYSLRGPQGVWIQNNKLYVADTQNNRVLIWNTIPTQNNQGADIVLGQNDFTHNTQPASLSNPTAAANKLLNPTSVTVTPDGTHLIVSDLAFNRVLIWNSIPTSNAQNADVVVGQVNMTNASANESTVCTNLGTGPFSECQASLNYPRFAIFNGQKLFVADSGNDRVLIWNELPTTNGVKADAVLGQPDFQQDVVSSASISIASTAIDNTGGVDLLLTPQSIAYDPATGNTFVSDPYNRRVLVFTPGDYALLPNSVVNWASEIVRQEGLVQFAVTSGGTITKGDKATITINGTAYAYTEATGDTIDSIAKGLVALINAGSGDPYVTAIFAGNGLGTVYLSSKASNLGYDTITLATSVSNTANVTVTASGSYLSAGTAATGALGMLVEINANFGATLADQTATATLDGVNPLPTKLGGVQVYMDGLACPLLKVSPSQIVTQIPYQYSDRNSTSVYVRTEHSGGSATVTSAMPVYIAPANPGLFNAPITLTQSRPWPISMATHQSGNATAVVSIDGSVTAGNIVTITIAGVAYSYTVQSADSLLSIVGEMITKINASDTNVVASQGGAFHRIVLTAKQPGAAGNGITVAGSTSTSATVDVTAYNTVTCCLVTPGSLITTQNPAAPGELINVFGVGLGAINDINANSLASSLTTGSPYTGNSLNTAASYVTATMGGSTAQVINAELPQNSYGIYEMQMVVPTGLSTNSTTPLYVAQNAFISNTVTIPVGPPVLGPFAPISTISGVVDSPQPSASESGTFAAYGWGVDSQASIAGVNIYVDGTLVGAATIHTARPDVCTLYTSPDCPNTGWSLPIDSTQYADGTHTLTATILSSSGAKKTIAQQFVVANSGTSVQTGFHSSIDTPGPNYIYRGSVTFTGWATNDSATVSAVTLYIDGVLRGTATYGLTRADVCAVYPLSPSCNTAAVGWSFPIDLNTLASGTHTLMAKSVANGVAYAISQTFQVANWNGSGTTRGVIDGPNVNAGSISGKYLFYGWAVDDRIAVNTVSVSIDGVQYGNASYGAARPDVCAYYNDAGCPNVGWNFYLDTTLLADGQHTLAVSISPLYSQSLVLTRTFTVANQQTAANPVRAYIDGPAPNETDSGLLSPRGWAISTADLVTSVALLIDGNSYGNALLGASRGDVCAALPAAQGCPNVGWYTPSNWLDTNRLGNGTHVLEATMTTAQGYRASVSQVFTVNNVSNGPGHVVFTNPSASSNPFLGKVLFSGYAVNDNAAVTSVAVLIDGAPFGAATFGLSSPTACASYPGRANCANSGWSYGLDTTTLADGTHTLGITENANGSIYTFTTSFMVANQSTSNPMTVYIDSPQNQTANGLFGTIAMAGWAIDNYSAISAVNVAIDDVPVGQAFYGASRGDVCAAYPGRQGCPNVGWTFNYDTSLLFNGYHEIEITAVTVAGQSSTVTRAIRIAN